jgi:O-antigen/teichoic acid export membrane protein
VLFLFLAGPLVEVVYQGRYLEAIPMLQIFAGLAFVVPAMTIASNILLGLGQARLGFILGVILLGASILFYFIFIPWLGPIGATVAYVLSSLTLAWISLAQAKRFVPITFREVLGRTHDITAFVKYKLGAVVLGNSKR